jgi:hypothetical protein
MASTIFEAPQYDPRRERRRKLIIAGVLIIVIAGAVLAWLFRNWPEERVADQFFTALEQKDYERAYGLWFADPNWKQHPEKYKKYPFNEFYTDWGPGGEWGLVKEHKVIGSLAPRGGSGVIVEVRVNNRVEPARLWVEKSDKTLTFSPM